MQSEETPIQWYPGHIAKLERELQQVLKQLDVVIEVLDARIPRASTYVRLSQMVRELKPVLLVLNKADLADPNRTRDWVDYFRTLYPEVTSFDSKTGAGKGQIVQAVQRLGEPQMKRQEAKGLKRRPIRVGIIGMPNVGKSSLINSLIGNKKVKTGHRAGVTRTTQWVRIHPAVELMDTPGLIPPKLESVETGKLLACAYSVGDAAFDEEAILPFFLEQVAELYPGQLHQALDLPQDAPLTVETIAERRHYVVSGGQLDLKRTAQAVLKDYRLGRLGRITLEKPNE